MDHFTYRDGRLHAEDVDLAGLAERVGTPCYVYSRATLERHWRVFDDALDGHPHLVCYAVKANSSLAVLQVLARLGAGFDIVSTSEELSFPWLDNADEASRVDAAAKSAGKTVLGTGVNPGFLMDSLPLFVTSIAQQVDHIDVTRVINASKRRGPFQAKIGSGMEVDAFNAKMACCA